LQILELREKEIKWLVRGHSFSLLTAVKHLICAHLNIWQDSQLDDGGRYAVEVDFFFYFYINCDILLNNTVDLLTLGCENLFGNIMSQDL